MRTPVQTPYHKDDLLTVTIEDIGNDGEGIGKIDGYTVFIKDAVMGDTVRAKVMKATPKYCYARLMEVVEASTFRTTPKCAISRQCGGCQLQSLSYEKQLEFKERKVANALQRIGGFPEEEIAAVSHPIVGMEDPYHYRNKAQFPVGEKDGEPVTGFFAGRTHHIVPTTACYIGAEENQKILETILSYMKEHHVAAYHEDTGKGVIRHVLIRSGVYSREVMVCIVANATKLPHEEDLVRLLSVLPNMTSISINTNTSNTNVIMGKKLRTLWGQDTIEDVLHVCQVSLEQKEGVAQANLPIVFTPTEEAVKFHISPLSFYQVNPKQTEKLYSLVRKACALTGKETVWDLYCGIGTISLFLAGQARIVYGVEIVPEAIADAKRNAEENGIKNVMFEVGKAEVVIQEYAERHRQKSDDKVDVIVVDPPRKGLDSACIEAMLQVAPPKIVYVSCDPATLARDAKLLCEGGYHLEEVTPVDQFGHTVHVETVVLLKKN